MSYNSEETTPVLQNEVTPRFLTGKALANLEAAEANPYIKISSPDKIIHFVVLPDGGVIADNTAQNSKIILRNFDLAIATGKGYGAGYMEIFHGNKIIEFHHVESTIFDKKWRIDDVIAGLANELNAYYPGYFVRSH
jgi:hypothetical protein